MFDEFRNMFSWQAAPEATKYELEVKNKTTLQATTYETATTAQKVELARGDYLAKVRAISEASPAQYSDWSAEIGIVIKFAAPAQFKYNPAPKKFSWNAVAGATIYQIVQDGATDDIYMGAGTSCEHEVIATAKFRIRAGNEEASSWGEWSDWLTVTV